MALIDERDRVAVFLDGQFLLRGLNVTCRGQLFDFCKIVAKLVAPGRVTRAWFCDAPPPPYLPDEVRRSADARLERIKSLPFFDVCMGRLQRRTRTVKLERSSGSSPPVSRKRGRCSLLLPSKVRRDAFSPVLLGTVSTLLKSRGQKSGPSPLRGPLWAVRPW